MHSTWRNFLDLLSTNSHTLILHRFPVQDIFPVLLTLYFTPQLQPHMAFKRYHSSEQRCVTYEDYAEPCKPLPDRRGCPEHFKSARGRLPDVGCCRCRVTALSLPLHYTDSKWQQRVIQQESFSIGMAQQISFRFSSLLIHSLVML